MIPYVRDIDIRYGACDQVSPLIRRVTANNPGPFTFKGTGTYIVGRGEVAVIDPGPDDPEHLAAILKAVAGERVVAIPITHHHADHSPLAAALKAATGATIYGCAVAHHHETDADAPRMEAGHDMAFTQDVSLCGGGTISGPGWTLEAIPTPGHTSNHLCYALPQENALFSGDHIMGWSTTVISSPDGDMTAYLDSLAKIRARDFQTLWPTHGPPILQVRPFIEVHVLATQAAESRGDAGGEGGQQQAEAHEQRDLRAQVRGAERIGLQGLDRHGRRRRWRQHRDQDRTADGAHRPCDQAVGRVAKVDLVAMHMGPARAQPAGEVAAEACRHHLDRHQYGAEDRREVAAGRGGAGPRRTHLQPEARGERRQHHGQGERGNGAGEDRGPGHRRMGLLAHGIEGQVGLHAGPPSGVQK